ncbi:MAG: ClpP family protease [Oscillospiraceae bacterium]|nr:ClpP family protease [Oscillospiraceae bacterium]
MNRVPLEDISGIHEIEMHTAQLMQGVVPLIGEINSQSAEEIIFSLRYLAQQGKDVVLILNSPGGEVLPGLAIVDAVKAYPYQLSVLCMSLAASMGAIILASCPKGRRLILPHAKVMIHEPLIAGGLGGSVTTIEKTAQSMVETKAILNQILAECTGRTMEEIDKATAFDNYMTAKEAIAFGLCDAISSPYSI